MRILRPYNSKYNNDYNNKRYAITRFYFRFKVVGARSNINNVHWLEAIQLIQFRACIEKRNVSKNVQQNNIGLIDYLVKFWFLKNSFNDTESESLRYMKVRHWSIQLSVSKNILSPSSINFRERKNKQKKQKFKRSLPYSIKVKFVCASWVLPI